MIVLQGDEGVGKDILIENCIARLLGDHLYASVDSAERLLAKFNQSLMFKVLLCLQEGAVPRGPASEQLKARIYKNTASLEPKGVDARQVRSVERYIMTTNKVDPVIVSSTDRHYLVLRVSNAKRGDRAYFSRLAAACDDSAALREVYDHLLAVDLSSWDPTDYPRTDAHAELARDNLHPVVRFAADWVNAKGDGGATFVSDDLFREFESWRTDQRIKCDISKPWFVRVLKADACMRYHATPTRHGYAVDVGAWRRSLAEIGAVLPDGELDVAAVLAFARRLAANPPARHGAAGDADAWLALEDVLDRWLALGEGAAAERALEVTGEALLRALRRHGRLADAFVREESHGTIRVDVSAWRAALAATGTTGTAAPPQ